MRSPRQRRVSAEAIPAVAAAYLHMEPQQLGHLGLASELQVQVSRIASLKGARNA